MVPKQLQDGIGRVAKAAVNKFLRETVVPQVDATLQAPEVTAMVTKKVKEVFKDAMAEKQRWDGPGSDLERMIDDQVDQTIKTAVLHQLSLYLNVTPWRSSDGSNEVEIRERIRDLAARRVADHFKALPSTVDTIVTKFLQDVEQGKIPPRVKQDLYNNLWDDFIRVARGQFREMLGAPVDEEDE
jgi:hypothetical protein